VRDGTPENEAYARSLAEQAGGVQRTTVIDRFLPDEEFDLWVAAADWVVLPYRRSWSSGVLARAHALGTPAILSDVGGLAEQAGDRDVVVGDDDELARALKEAVAGDSTERRASPAGPPGHDHAASEWDPDFEPPDSEKGRPMLFVLILVSVLLAALAQLTLKHGMTQVTRHGDVPLDLHAPLATFGRIATNLSVWAGLLTFVVSAAVWLIVLSRASLSFAYPFASLTYVLILLFDSLVLHEKVSGLRWGGVALIIGGILLVSRTHGQ
jgi:hypothetical protein